MRVLLGAARQRVWRASGEQGLRRMGGKSVRPMVSRARDKDSQWFRGSRVSRWGRHVPRGKDWREGQSRLLGC